MFATNKIVTIATYLALYLPVQMKHLDRFKF